MVWRDSSVVEMVRQHVADSWTSHGGMSNKDFAADCISVGDVCYYDEKERFFVVDRIKELIKYKAFQVVNCLPYTLSTMFLLHTFRVFCYNNFCQLIPV